MTFVSTFQDQYMSNFRPFFDQGSSNLLYLNLIRKNCLNLFVSFSPHFIKSLVPFFCTVTESLNSF